MGEKIFAIDDLKSLHKEYLDYIVDQIDLDSEPIFGDLTKRDLADIEVGLFVRWLQTKSSTSA